MSSCLCRRPDSESGTKEGVQGCLEASVCPVWSPPSSKQQPHESWFISSLYVWVVGGGDLTFWFLKSAVLWANFGCWRKAIVPSIPAAPLLLQLGGCWRVNALVRTRTRVDKGGAGGACVFVCTHIDCSRGGHPQLSHTHTPVSSHIKYY